MRDHASILLLAIFAGLATAAAQETVTVSERADAEERFQAASWGRTADTGQKDLAVGARSQGLASLLVLSPDRRFLLLGEPDERGLDVMTYRLFLVSLADWSVRPLVELALEGTFSPTSDSLFLATGPHPVLFNLKSFEARELEAIPSGLENYPVWVSSWSGDGRELIVHQQQRFDSAEEPRAWTVRISKER
jgi:hypothetical protein